MASNPFLNTLQATALKELQKFTGDPAQKVTQFVNAVEQIAAFTALDDPMLHSIATIKLGGPAFNWYDNNKTNLNTWTALKSHLLERFKPSLSLAKTQLKERRQLPGESLLTFYDDVIDLCKQVDSDMPLHMIVDYLQDGIRDTLKVHVKRRMRALADAPDPAMFLKIARDEEELQHELSSSQPSIADSPQPYFARLTAATTTSAPHSAHSTPVSRFSNDHSTRFPRAATSASSPSPHTGASRNSYRPCLICTRTTHRTIDCYLKHPSGCFKCGAPDHAVRSCPQVFQ